MLILSNSVRVKSAEGGHVLFGSSPQLLLRLTHRLVLLHQEVFSKGPYIKLSFIPIESNLEVRT